MEIAENSLVKIHYKGTLEDGSVFDSSEGREALEFIFGLGMIIPGLEEGLKGLKVGDKKSVKVSAEKAYGPRMDEAMQEVPKSQLPADAEIKIGMQLAAQGPQGVIPVTIAEIKDDIVVVDFNHPLAGKDLTFDVTVEEVRESTPEDMKKIMPSCESGNCGDCSDGSCESKSGSLEEDLAVANDENVTEEKEDKKAA